ncbi:LPS assembly lipoprotein LptE [Trinickia sp. Y13]|uniref:LPS-assembly lipoprotein LptE n=1 Tax=Trinickia sp. Y13 TaxID=2917807 RepID=UPI0024058300|nr:LPS assembly lipoprotein LptE [Trinickia sp. Y13]MDG0025261.1 LPS assembly lipoprotein LptE [Trinickia sp. Y13]
MIRRSFLALMCGTMMLAACGFQLRGQENYAFKRLAIVGAPPIVAARLTRMIEGGSDTIVVKSPRDADAVLSLSEGRGQGVLTLNSLGVAAEYQLNYTLAYTLTGTDGAVLIPSSAIALNRAMTYSVQYSQAKAQEAELLYQDMQNDAVDQLTRRLAVVRSLHPAAGQQPPAVAPRAPLPPPPL